MMTLIDARWTPARNILRLRCACLHFFEAPADRWRVRCPACGLTDSLAAIRARELET